MTTREQLDEINKAIATLEMNSRKNIETRRQLEKANKALIAEIRDLKTKRRALMFEVFQSGSDRL
jgi:septal ring factor EnvC (AmiA/AmiB activator)